MIGRPPRSPLFPYTTLFRSALVMQERASFERPSDHVRIRGAFSSLGDKVYADVPAALGPLPASELPNRLGLARWLASRDRKSTRLNSSHANISYAVFCLKKK